MAFAPRMMSQVSNPAATGDANGVKVSCACPTRTIVYLAMAEGIWLALLVAGPVLAASARDHFRDLGVALPTSTQTALRIAGFFELPGGVVPIVACMMVLSMLFVGGLMVSRIGSADSRALVGRLAILAAVLGALAWIVGAAAVVPQVLSAAP